MEEIKERVHIDASGRVVIPADARRAARVGRDVQLIATRGEIILRSTVTDTDGIEKWYREMKASTVRAGGKTKETGKWVSEGYARKKLGL